MKRKSKKQVGARLIYNLSHKSCTLLDINDTNFTVEFDDKKVKTYSLGSLESKFNLADDVNMDPVSVVEEVQDSDIIVGQVEVVIDEENTNSSVQKQDNKQKQAGKLLKKDKKLSDYKLLVEQLSSQIQDSECLIAEHKKLLAENNELRVQVQKQDNEHKSCVDKLQQANEELTRQLKDYEQIINKLNSQVQNSDKLLNDCKKLVNENDSLKEQIKSVQNQDNEQDKRFDKLLQENNDLKKQITELIAENEKLTVVANAPHAGGRPKKFTDDSIVEQMKKCRDKGESYRKIAKRFNCSVGYVFKALNQ